MKTFPLNRVVLAGLAAVLTASAARADDVGIARLGHRASTTSSTSGADGGVVVRGQSSNCPPSAPKQRGLLQLFSKKPQCVPAGADNCDGCDGVPSVDSCDGCVTAANCDACDGCESIPGSGACDRCACGPGCRCEPCDCCDCGPICDCVSCDCCDCTAASDSCEESGASGESIADSDPREDSETPIWCDPREDSERVVGSDPCKDSECAAGADSCEGIETAVWSEPRDKSEIAAGAVPYKGIEIVSWSSSRVDTQSRAWCEPTEDCEITPSFYEPRTDADITDCFLEPCTGSDFVEAFLQPSMSSDIPESLLSRCGGTDDSDSHIGSRESYAGHARCGDLLDCAPDVRDGCLAGYEPCDLSCDDALLGRKQSHDGGLRSLFGNLLGYDSSGSGADFSHSYGSGKCRDCNGRGCRRCRGQGRRTHRNDSGLAGGRFNRFHNGPTHCPHGYAGGRCPLCSSRAFVNNNRVARFLGNHAARYRARNHAANQGLNAYLRCKLGYFLHDGCGGVGCKPFGHYSMVYPNNPGYFDGRDGQIYAAQGVGGPVSVPLAPVVRHSYNYGWGLPSSRLTPISHSVY